eukprot:scaffold664579_cov51-Attheya_sp.AAC.1
MTYKWRKRLYKEADVSFEVPVGTYFWGKPMFEKLIIAIVFPVLDASPWRLKRTPAVLALEGQLPEMWEHNICSARTSAFVGTVGKSAKGHGAVPAIPRVKRTSSLSRNL